MGQVEGVQVVGELALHARLFQNGLEGVHEGDVHLEQRQVVEVLAERVLDLDADRVQPPEAARRQDGEQRATKCNRW